jgi:hypothetical protein
MSLFPDATPRCLQGGLDLAGAGLDYSALAVAERLEVYRPGERVPRWDFPSQQYVPTDKIRHHYVVRLIKRWPRGTDPGDVLLSLGRALARPELDGLRIRWDATGLGGGLRGVVRDMTRDGIFANGQMDAVVITAGESSQMPGGLPKQDLVSGLSRVVHEQRLHFAPDLPDGEELRREAHAYVAKPLESGRFKYEAAGSGHDDLVTALALACYQPMRRFPAWRLPWDLFRDQVLTGAVDKSPVVVWPKSRAGEFLS